MIVFRDWQAMKVVRVAHRYGIEDRYPLILVLQYGDALLHAKNASNNT